MTARECALRALLRMERDGAYASIVAQSEARALSDARDVRLALSLVYGVCERRITLDYIGGKLAKRQMKELSPHARALLRLALYQLFYMQRLPAYAVVSETVSLARQKGERAFLNAVLRRAAEDTDVSHHLPPREKDELRYLSVSESVPLPLLRLLWTELGEAQTRDFLSAINAPPYLTLRVNTQKTDRDTLTALLTEAGYDACQTQESPFGICVSGAAAVTELPHYEDGWFFVQDESSQIAVLALAPEKGMRVLDTCACPGGKTFSALCMMQGIGNVCAHDLHESKLSLIASSAVRLGFTLAELSARDASLPLPRKELGAYDCVICDVPCSGLGVLGKKPDLRHKDLTDIEKLPELQARILENAATAVKAGGRLLYATCTVLSRENGEVVSAFLAENTDFTLKAERLLLPTKTRDGFYYAVLEKRNG